MMFTITWVFLAIIWQVLCFIRLPDLRIFIPITVIMFILLSVVLGWSFSLYMNFTLLTLISAWFIFKPIEKKGVAK